MEIFLRLPARKINYLLQQVLRNFYISTIVVIFMISMVMQIPRLKIKDNVKITVFVSWAAFGVVPTVHWYFEMGGSENTMVNVSL